MYVIYHITHHVIFKIKTHTIKIQKVEIKSLFIFSKM